MTELQQQGLQVCENNWVRRIARVTKGRQEKNGGVKGRDRGAKELDRETGEEQTDYSGQDTLKGWRMIAAEVREEGRRRRGRPRLRC